MIDDPGNIVHEGSAEGSAYALLFPFALLSLPLVLSPTKPSIILSSTKKLLAFMSHAHSAASSNFQLIMNNALDKYKNSTKNDLITHPLTAQIQSCNSPSDILAVLHQQARGLDQSQSTDERWSRWLDPTVNVIYVLSSTLAAGASLAFPPANVIFAGIGILLSAAKETRASQEALIDIFERIEMFFRRLEIYTELPSTMEMMDITIQIMVEILSILGIATKEIKQGRTKKYVGKLIGRTEIKDALKRLDKLTQEEVRMAAAQNLKVTHAVADAVAGVDGRVQQMADELKRNQLRESIHKWLSPPDPSTNHNIACGIHHKKMATWFFQGSIFQEWKSSGSLLWIHGKPGSGKSVMCSTVIQDVEAMCEAANASMAYFYFDFRDANKQGLRDLVTSLLTQLSVRSGPRCDILSDLYSAHDEGKKQPSDSTLTECLRNMLTLPDQPPTYLIIDALDESSNTSGIPSPRETVLQLLEELVNLSLTNLHICVTSRPEIDIRNVLEPLTSCRVSLHDQTGQRKDIEDYVRSVVYSSSQQIMRRWKAEDKELVITTLSERADGMFRWVFCQLETLRHCLPPSVRRTLNELPESLDGTYERVLKEIAKPNRDHARRLLQCLVVAIRPLDVKELAEVLAVDFDDAERMPKLKPDWRWEDEEQAILTSCSSLITTVETDDSRVVQFSHFSVKEYLTSERLSTSDGDVSRYHIDLEAAHTILAQACMSVLLQVDGTWLAIAIDMLPVVKRSPLAGYAARHWATHAQFERVSSVLQKPMEYLFDLDRPYFGAWLRLHDIDANLDQSSPLYWFADSTKSKATPLYYAALCGFEDIVKYLVIKYPQHVDIRGGYYATPLFAAMAGRHFRTVKLLRRCGAREDLRSRDGTTPLHSAARCGELGVVQVLLDPQADVNASDRESGTPLPTSSEGSRLLSTLLHRLWSDTAGLFLGGPVNSRRNDGRTPLHLAEKADVVRVLLEHGGNVGAVDNYGSTPLHAAAEHGKVEVVRVLLEHGANVGAVDSEGGTTLHAAAQCGKVEVVHVLLEHGANVGAVDSEGGTTLHVAAERGKVEVVRVLLEHGANVGAVDNQGRTPLHASAQRGKVEVVRVLIEHGANASAVDNKGKIPLNLAQAVEVVRVLFELGGPNAVDNEGRTPLHAAAKHDEVKFVRMLLEQGADVGAVDNQGRTPLHAAAQCGKVEVACVLLEHGANAGAVNDQGRTPLYAAAQYGMVDAARVLLEHGANVGAVDNGGRTPLHAAVEDWYNEAVHVLLEHGANVGAVDNEGRTPLHTVALCGNVEVVGVLLRHGANVGAVDHYGSTPLHAATERGKVEVVRVLLEHGAKAGAVDNGGRTPLHAATERGKVDVVHVLLEYGANANAVDNQGRTPLHAAAQCGKEAVRVLLGRGANVDVVDNHGRTPLHTAVEHGKISVARVLVGRHGANIDAVDNQGRTAFQIASARKFYGIMRLLWEHGAEGAYCTIM